MIFYIKYFKVKGGYKADGSNIIFKRLSDLKVYFEHKSLVRVKFLKG